MRTTAEELLAFYATPLGALAEEFLRQKITDGWGDGKGLRMAGFGYAGPFLSSFTEAERVVSLAPASGGAIRRPGEVLVEEDGWPLRDASVDRLLIVHGIEEARDPRRLMREAWRVLTDDGRMIIIAANRHGFWTLLENSPLAAGRAYSRRQLMVLLNQSFFAPTAQASALYFPPIARLKPLAPLWERTAERLEPLAIPLPNVAGAILVEARRSMAVPASGSKLEVLGPVLGGVRRPSAVAAERERRRAR